MRINYISNKANVGIKLLHLPKQFVICSIILHNISTMAQPVIFMTRNDFPQKAIDLLKTKFTLKCWEDSNARISKEQLLKQVKGVFGIFCWAVSGKIDKDVLDAAGPSLKVISTMSVGYDHLDVPEIKSRGIRIGYTPDVLTEAVAELTLALTLAAGRRLFEAHNAILNGTWATNFSPLWMCGYGLQGATVGIVGMGRIGINVARKVKAFGISRLLYTSRKEKAEGKELEAEHMDIDDMIPQCDYILVTISLSEATKGIISRERIAKMKPTAVIVNVGRGGLVDQDALYEALRDKKIGAAGLDVMTPEPLPPDHPLLKLDNAVISPHIGSATFSTRFAMAEIAAKNILAVLEGTPMVAEL